MNTTSDTANTAPLIPMADPNPQPYEAVRFNALKHGILSRYTVLSHESHADYESLVNSLMDEHLPAGATEQHLIEELASVIWRKRRVLQAEGATINKGLKESARSAKTVIPAAAPFEMGLSGENTDIRNLMDLKPADVAESQQSARHDIDATNKASAILRKGGDRAYDKALRALLPDTREWWQNYVDDEEYTADATGLAAFITEHVTPFVYQQEKESRHHDAIVNQTIGEGLQAYRLEKLSRYETHLDRKFERTLAMLIKLKDLVGIQLTEVLQLKLQAQGIADSAKSALVEEQLRNQVLLQELAELRATAVERDTQLAQAKSQNMVLTEQNTRLQNELQASGARASELLAAQAVLEDEKTTAIAAARSVTTASPNNFCKKLPNNARPIRQRSAA
jgi:hypothetical protein